LTGIAILNNVNIWVCGTPGGANEYGVILYSPDAGTTLAGSNSTAIKRLYEYYYV